MKTIAALPVLIAFLVGALPARAWTWPVEGPVLRSFSFEGGPYAAGQHRGIDVGAPAGTPVRAPAGGDVTFAGSVPRYGRTVTITTSDGYAVTLVHLGETAVALGDSVDEGAQVGTVGPSGEPEVADPYVHLGVRLASAPEGYVDPLAFLPTVPAPGAASSEAPAGAEAVPTSGTEGVGLPVTAPGEPVGGGVSAEEPDPTGAANPSSLASEGGVGEPASGATAPTEEGQVGGDDPEVPGEAPALGVGEAGTATDGETTTGEPADSADDPGETETPADVGGSTEGVDPPVISSPNAEAGNGQSSQPDTAGTAGERVPADARPSGVTAETGPRSELARAGGATDDPVRVRARQTVTSAESSATESEASTSPNGGRGAEQMPTVAAVAPSLGPGVAAAPDGSSHATGSDHGLAAPLGAATAVALAAVAVIVRRHRRFLRAPSDDPVTDPSAGTTTLRVTDEPKAALFASNAFDLAPLELVPTAEAVGTSSSDSRCPVRLRTPGSDRSRRLRRDFDRGGPRRRPTPARPLRHRAATTHALRRR